MTILNRKRLIADEGKILVNGEIKATVVDCSKDEIQQWKEIDQDQADI